MPPKKKKAAGDAAKGERIFKNLCSACHSLSVSLPITFISSVFWTSPFYRLTQLVPLSVDCQETTSLLEKDSTIHLLWLLRPLSSGLMVTSTSGLSHLPILPQVMVWHSLVSQVARIDKILSLISREVERKCNKLL